MVDLSDTKIVDEILGKLLSVYGEGGLCPTRSQWKEFLEDNHTGRIAMINFIKLREVADYPEEPENKISGGDALGRYLEVSRRKVEEVGGKFVFTSMFGSILIGEPENWDAVGIVEYPNRDSFVSLFLDPEYTGCHHHRIAGTERHKMVFTKMLD